MNQGTQGYSLTKKSEGQKSRDTVSLNSSDLQYSKKLLLRNNELRKSYYFCQKPDTVLEVWNNSNNKSFIVSTQSLSCAKL
jgi:hypothetical protein